MPRSLLLIATLYLGLTLSYLFTVPVGEAPDEPAHFLYVQHMVETGQPPAAPPPQRASFWKDGFVTSNYEWHQPPLHYALSAILLHAGRLFSLTTPHKTFPAINPDFPGSMRPLFVVIPFTFTEVHLARLLSGLFGLGTVCATFALARRLFPDESWLPELAAGFVAFLPQFTFLHAYVTNDALAIFGSSLGLLGLTAVALANPADQRRAWLLAGFAAAIATAAKMTTWYLLPLALLLVGIHLLTRRRSLTASVVDLAVYGATASTGLLLSRILWPDLVYRLFNSPQSAGINPDFLTMAHLRSILPMVHSTFWGMFGWVNMPLPLHLLWPLDGILLISLVGAVLWAFRGWRELSQGQQIAIVLLMGAIGAVTAAFGYFNLTAIQPQSRLLFAALPAIGVVVATGWLHWAGTYRRAATLLFLALLLGVNLTGLLTVILPTYGFPSG